MKRTLSSALIILAGISRRKSPGLAHHSGTMFDTTKTIKVEGVVKKWELTNPHSWLWVEVKEKDGKVGGLGIRGRRAEHPVARRDQTERLQRRDETDHTGNPMRDGKKQAIWINAVRTSDGKKFDPRAGFAVK